MQLIVLCEGREDPVVLEVPEDSDVSLVLQLACAEISANFTQYCIEYDGVILPYEASLLSAGVLDGSMLFMKPVPSRGQLPQPAPATVASTASSITPAKRTAPPASTPSSSSGNARAVSLYDIPADIKPDDLMNLVHQHAHLLQQFKEQDPELGDTLASKDLPKLRALMMKRFMSKHKMIYQQKQDLIALESDPMNPELQKKIEEAIRLENIQENMAAALENLPEAFGRVTMLYVNIEVNGNPVKAFVDSGAQSTIMSAQCAERCGVTRLIDTRFAGQARGVGTARILGRIHIAQMKFGNSYFPISITILENNDVDFLFGLDTLRRYRCNIDLSRDLLVIEGVNGREEIPFLTESELPENARGTFEGPKDASQPSKDV